MITHTQIGCLVQSAAHLGVDAKHFRERMLNALRVVNGVHPRVAVMQYNMGMRYALRRVKLHS